MEGKTLSGQFPVSGFQKLARLVEVEGEVFQRHVLDYVRDVLEDADFHRSTMVTIKSRLPEKDIADFLAHLPAAPAQASKPADIKELLKLTEGLERSHASESDLAQLIASELIHRRKWEKVMEENPDTLQALKDRMVP
jgi:hypothetical protein